MQRVAGQSATFPERRGHGRCRWLVPLAAFLLAALPSAQEDGRELPGPQAVLRTFFSAMAEEDARTAVTTFEDGAFETAAEAEAAALTFYDDFFLKTERIQVQKTVPAEVEGDRWSLVTAAAEEPELTFTLEFARVEDGGFRFALETLARIDFWARELASVGRNQVLEKELSGGGWLEAQHERLRESLQGTPWTARSFVLENWQWPALLFLIAMAVVLDRFVRFVLSRLAVRLTRSENVRLDQETLLTFVRPTGLLCGVLLLEFLLPIVGLEEGVRSVLVLATSFVAAVAGVWAFYRLVDVLCDYLGVKAARTRSKFDDMLVPLLRRTLKIFVVLVGIVFVASRMSDDLWSVVAGLSLGSVAVGFAAKDSIENLFGTFTVLLDKPFQIGDWIIAGDLEGTVEEVGIRSTRIRTFYNSIITVPNSQFIAAAVDNMGERRYRRIRTNLALTYDTPPEKIEAFCEGVREIIRRHPYTRKDYYHVYLNAMGASSLDVLLYAFVETPEWGTELREKHRLFADILRLAERLQVSFAFSTQTLHVARPEDLEHPDRPGDDAAGARRGRKLAEEIVDKTLEPFGGSVPPPVTIQTRPVSGDDGADGG